VEGNPERRETAGRLPGHSRQTAQRYAQGKECQVVTGAFCQDNVPVIFAGKYQDCTDCKLYRAMRNEKGAGFTTSLVLLKKPKVLQEKTAALLDRRHLHLIE